MTSPFMLLYPQIRLAVHPTTSKTGFIPERATVDATSCYAWLALLCLPLISLARVVYLLVGAAGGGRVAGVCPCAL